MIDFFQGPLGKAFVSEALDEIADAHEELDCEMRKEEIKRSN